MLSSAPTLSETLERSTTTAREATEPLKNLVSQEAHKNIDYLTAKANQIVVTVSETVEKAKASFDENRQRAEPLNDSVAETVQKALSTTLQNWLEAHPLLAWLIAHPLLTLAIILLICWLFWGLLNASGRLTEKAWLAILQFPLKLGQWLWRQIARGFKGISPGSNRLSVKPTSAKEDHQRLADILSRLETLHQEQEQLMKEMQTILSVSQVATEPAIDVSSAQEPYPDQPHTQY